MRTLQELRKSLDVVDDALVALLAERFRLTHEVGLYKKEYHLPPVDKKREAAQFKRIAEKAQRAGLDSDYACRILRITIDEVVKNHKKMQHSTDSSRN